MSRSNGSNILGEIVVRLVIKLAPIIWEGICMGTRWCMRKLGPSVNQIMLRGVDKSDTNIVRAALKEGAQINAFDGEALCRASRKGDEPMIDLLLDQPGIGIHGIGRDGEKLGFTSDRALYEARKGHFNSIADKLIEHGASEAEAQKMLARDAAATAKLPAGKTA